jgi:hypothetical protein
MTMSRRQVLAALAAAGGAGALTGSGTGALLQDTTRSGGRLTTGIVDVVVDYWLAVETEPVDLSDPDGRVDGPRLDIPVGTIGPDDSGATLLRISRPESDAGVNNPASVWLRTLCPAPTTLGEQLEVRLNFANAGGFPTEPVPGAGTFRPLRELADTLREGVRLDADCLATDLFVLVEYRLGAYVGSETVSLPVELAAVQCRNADPDVNPFPADAIDGPCEPGYDCPCCWAIGKVEVDAPFQPGQRYPFTEGLAGYALDVTAVDGDSGVAFELVATDDSPVLPLCEVQVKGGPNDERYERSAGTFGTDTTTLDGTTDGVVYAPDNPNSGGRYGISYVLVSVCVPETDGECPADVVAPAASVGSGAGGPSSGRGRGGGQR